MSYEIDAFLGKSSDLRNWNEGLGATVVFNLTAELGLVPLTSDLVRALQRNWRRAGNPKTNWCSAGASRRQGGTVVAFVSANYFGGQGGQSAAMWANQKIVKS